MSYPAMLCPFYSGSELSESIIDVKSPVITDKNTFL
jgi:hypothetical protein